MFLSDKFIYVDLNKTGTVSVMNWLKKLNVPLIDCQHHLKPSDELIDSDKIKFATVRDPWSYYLSLWTYGCKKTQQSGPYNSLTKFSPLKHRGFSNNRWGATKSVLLYLLRSLSENWSRNKELYLDPENPELFRQWLRKLLDTRTSVFLSGSYYSSGIHTFAGLYTYRFCNLYCKNDRTLHSGSIGNRAKLEAWVDANLYIDKFLNTGTLQPEFLSFIQDFSLVPKDADLSCVRSTKMNSSKSGTVDLGDFYDEDTIEMIVQREMLIVNRFNYDFEKVNSLNKLN